MNRRDGAGKVWAQERRGTALAGETGAGGKVVVQYKRVMSWHQDGRVDPACHLWMRLY
jgi:hypothetical protein